MEFDKGNLEKFEYYVAWTLAPRSYRAKGEETETALATTLGITRQTLNNWAKLPEFVTQSRLVSSGLAQLRKNHIEAEAYDAALQLGWQDKAFFMKCFGDWKEKTETTHKVISFTDIVEADKTKELKA
jgi:hypothetical protein